MTHVIITRMLYPENSPAFDERLAFYRSLVLPRLKAQSVKDFDIAVLCGRYHADIFERLGLIPFHLKNNWLGQKPGKFWSCFTTWDNIEGLEKYDVQSNLDSDDLVSDKYVERIRRAVEVDGGKQSLHIHFQPRLFNLLTLEEKPQKKQYGLGVGSAFYSLYQPDKTNYAYIGQDSHLRAGSYADKSILIGEGYCWIGIHDNNDSTTMDC